MIWGNSEKDNECWHLHHLTRMV